MNKLIIYYRCQKNAAFAMRYMLRKFLIGCFEAKIVPTNKIKLQVVNNM